MKISRLTRARARTVFMLVVVTAMLPAQMMLPAQNGTGTPPAPTLNPPITPKLRNNRYTVTYPNSTQSWKAGNNVVTAGAISQAVADNLAQQLSAKGFVRVKPLDVQCCNVQLQILDAGSAENQFRVTIRITVLDLDSQFIYARQYRGEAPTGASEVAAAAADIGKNAVADSDLLKALARN